MATLTIDQTASLNTALNGPVTTNQDSPVILAPTSAAAVAPNAADNPTTGPTNTPIYASGNGKTSQTAIKQSDQTLAHACDTGAYVNAAAFQAGAFAGQIIAGIRAGIKAILEFLGISPSSTGITNQLKKLAQYISDTAKFINEITADLQQYVSYINAIKQLLSYLLSLPVELLKYFKDCVTTVEKQIAAGYASAISDTVPSSPSDDSLSAALQSVGSSIKTLTTSLATVTATTAAATLSLTLPTTLNSGNTQAQAAATQAVFAAAGFTPPGPAGKP